MKDRSRWKKDARYCDASEFLTLSLREETMLKGFICMNLVEIKSINRRHSSYQLKHAIEKRVGFYVSNADLKKAMSECGFIHAQSKGIAAYWYFNVSEKSIKQMNTIQTGSWDNEYF